MGNAGELVLVTSLLHGVRGAGDEGGEGLRGAEATS